MIAQTAPGKRFPPERLGQEEVPRVIWYPGGLATDGDDIALLPSLVIRSSRFSPFLKHRLE